MLFHEAQRNRFLSRPVQTDAQTILGNAANYAVRLEPTAAPANHPCWRVVGVHHLTPEENQGKHAIYVDAVDETGQPLRHPNLRLAWGWEGQASDEVVDPKPFDKGEDEPASNVEMWRGQQTWVQVQGDGLPSDRLLNLHTSHPDEPTADDQKWNSLGHHSFYVLFQRSLSGAQSQPPAGDVIVTQPDTPQRKRPPEEQPAAKTPSAPPPSPGNRLGFYLHVSLDQLGLWEAIQRVQPPVILVHADTANRMLLEEIRRFRAPDAFVIGRMFKDVHSQGTLLESSDPAAEGRALAQQILDHDFGLATQRGANGRLLIDAWMSLNEAVPGPASRQFAEQPAEVERLLRAYDRFQVAFQQRLQEAGVAAVAFNFAAGNFNQPAHYLDYFHETLATHTYLGFHEYGWPALPPGAPGDSVATSAGDYRRCMEGIRARFGDRHRVIITEAGLTRAYQDPTLGDIGWLNEHTPLSEEEYWRSLAWYNNLLLQDSYVQGACLYEVGHHGDWISFRHLGQDNQGNDLHLIDRIMALKDSVLNEGTQPRTLSAITPAPTIERQPLTIRGRVILAGKAIPNATVRLIGGAETIGMQRHASLHAPSYITWSQQVSGFGGSLWNCWRRLVAQQVAGISWPEFKQEMVRYNPGLVQDENRLRAEQTYRLPENKDYSLEIAWDRPVTGFEGSLWAGWEQLVANRVVGLSFASFKRGMIEHNPSLVASKGRLHAEQRYNLPRNANHKEYALVTTTNRRGQFSFVDLPPGQYRVEMRAVGAEPFTTGFSCVADLTLPITLQPSAPPDAVASRDLGAASARSVGLAGMQSIAIDQQLYTVYYVNLRRDPGYVGKAGDHVIGQIPYGVAVSVIGGPIDADGLTWWALRAPLLDNTVAVGWAAATDPKGKSLFERTVPPVTPPVTPPVPGETGAQFKSGDRVQVVAVQVNVRRTAGYRNQPSDHILATVLEGARFSVTGGAQQADGLDWWQVKGVHLNGGELSGWVAVVGPDGRRLLALEATAQAIQVRRPFAERWPLTQGWGSWPEFYGRITYDGVPLQGHNGLDFGTPVNTPLLAVDAGEVIRVDFEPGGFGHHILLRHAWGESLYAHLERVDVAVSSRVAAGQQIGLSGNTGGSTGPHLHFGIRVFPYRRTDGWGGFCDPSPYMDPADLGRARALGSARSLGGGQQPMAPELPGRVRP